jgi:hypothetical protein
VRDYKLGGLQDEFSVDEVVNGEIIHRVAAPEP